MATTMWLGLDVRKLTLGDLDLLPFFFWWKFSVGWDGLHGEITKGVVAGEGMMFGRFRPGQQVGLDCNLGHRQFSGLVEITSVSVSIDEKSPHNTQVETVSFKCRADEPLSRALWDAQKQEGT